MGIGFAAVSNFDYETAEEEAISVLGTVSWGTIVLRDRRDGSRLDVKYRCVSFGHGKGLPLGMSHSSFNNWSGGDSVVCNRWFDANVFPCRGYIIGAGGGFGFTETEANSLTATVALFGMAPVFAGVRMWGASVAALPGIGMSAGLAAFRVED